MSRQRLQQVVLALRFELPLELGVGVEVIFDRALERAGDEHQPCGRPPRAPLPRVLDQRLVDDRQHLLGLALVAGKKRVPRPATGKTAVRILGIDDLSATDLENDTWTRRDGVGATVNTDRNAERGRGRRTPRARAGRDAQRFGRGIRDQMFALLISTIRAPIPLTRVNASGVSKLPCSARSLTIACASAGPTP